MDLNKLFLGDFLGDIDLGGLSKLGFNAAKGFDSDGSAVASPERNSNEDNSMSEEESKQ